MDTTAGDGLDATGFLTALEDAHHGWFGGYLVLSDLGRPLEFRCTTPVEPSQAQKILYGPTLRPYLLGEVLGQTLIQRAELPVRTILTDLPDMLGLALLTDIPVAWIEPIQIGSQESPVRPTTECQHWPLSRATAKGQPVKDQNAPTIVMKDLRIRGTTTCHWDPKQLQADLHELEQHIELREPFERIREAIREAQRISDTPADDHHDLPEAA